MVRGPTIGTVFALRVGMKTTSRTFRVGLALVGTLFIGSGCFAESADSESADVVNENLDPAGYLTGLVATDAQNSTNAASLVDGATGNSLAQWHSSNVWDATKYPMRAIVDLGQAYDVTEINLFHGDGSGLVNVKYLPLGGEEQRRELRRDRGAQAVDLERLGEGQADGLDRDAVRRAHDRESRRSRELLRDPRQGHGACGRQRRWRLEFDLEQQHGHGRDRGEWWLGRGLVRAARMHGEPWNGLGFADHRRDESARG